MQQRSGWNWYALSEAHPKTTFAIGAVEKRSSIEPRSPILVVRSGLRGIWSMTVKKLTAADRTEILDLYRNTGETTSTLADRYGVSNSTISRFLKVTLPEDEYETLIAAKRAARTPGGGEKEEVAASPVVKAPVVVEKSIAEKPVVEPVIEAPILKSTSETDSDDEDDDDFEEDTTPVIRRRLPVESFVRVLPLSEAMLPRTCYIVIDRMAELITRPLRDFADLGQIPVQEVQQKTLPIFDNHRVARRFSSKRDRVIKVPDSRMLQKTRSQLQSKGITRLLFDGRVYSLSSN
jgi:transposase-like protein